MIAIRICIVLVLLTSSSIVHGMFDWFRTKQESAFSGLSDAEKKYIEYKMNPRQRIDDAKTVPVGIIVGPSWESYAIAHHPQDPIKSVVTNNRGTSSILTFKDFAREDKIDAEGIVESQKIIYNLAGTMLAFHCKSEGFFSKTLKLFHLISKKKTEIDLPGHICDVAFGANDLLAISHLAQKGYSTPVYAITQESFKEEKCTQKPKYIIPGFIMRFNPKTNIIATDCSKDQVYRGINLYNSENGDVIAITHPTRSFSNMQWKQDDGIYIAGLASQENKIYIIDRQGKDKMQIPLPPTENNWYGLNTWYTGKTLPIFYGKTVKIYDIDKPGNPLTFDHDNIVNNAAVDPQAKRLVTTQRDKIIVYDLNTNKLIQTIPSSGTNTDVKWNCNGSRCTVTRPTSFFSPTFLYFMVKTNNGVVDVVSLQKELENKKEADKQ